MSKVTESLLLVASLALMGCTSMDSDLADIQHNVRCIDLMNAATNKVMQSTDVYLDLTQRLLDGKDQPGDATQTRGTKKAERLRIEGEKIAAEATREGCNIDEACSEQ